MQRHDVKQYARGQREFVHPSNDHGQQREVHGEVNLRDRIKHHDEKYRNETESMVLTGVAAYCLRTATSSATTNRHTPDWMYIPTHVSHSVLSLAMAMIPNTAQ